MGIGEKAWPSASSEAPWWLKGLPVGFDPAQPAPAWNLLDGNALLPLVTLRESAVRANSRAMMEYCERFGVSLAPHGKTTMSPRLFALQLEAGCWGVTAATAWQVRAMRGMGQSRILLANVLVDRAGVEYVSSELDADPEFTFLCYVDCLEGVQILNDVLRNSGARRPMCVLVELGQTGGRTGARSIHEAVEVARAVKGCETLWLAGVAGFEGLIRAAPAAMLGAVDDFLLSMRKLLITLDEQHLLAENSIVTAGGSAYFDRVIEHLTGFGLSSAVQTILRSGGYIAHDAKMYERISPLAGRRTAGETLRFRPSLDLWATVWSRPEPDLAILGFGKRDASFDYGLPVPLEMYRSSGELGLALRDQAHVLELNDQHAYMRISSRLEMHPGDTVRLGLSHPCTVFDKWKAVPLIDDLHNVVDLVYTYF